jgi:hypothetical protein
MLLLIFKWSIYIVSDIPLPLKKTSLLYYKCDNLKYVKTNDHLSSLSQVYPSLKFRDKYISYSHTYLNFLLKSWTDPIFQSKFQDFLRTHINKIEEDKTAKGGIVYT